MSVSTLKLKKYCEDTQNHCGNQKDILIKYLFIVKTQASDFQQELLKEIVVPVQALLYGINMELGHRNQLQFSNSQSAAQANAILPQFQFSNMNP